MGVERQPLKQNLARRGMARQGETKGRMEGKGYGHMAVAGAKDGELNDGEGNQPERGGHHRCDTGSSQDGR